MGWENLSIWSYGLIILGVITIGSYAIIMNHYRDSIPLYPITRFVFWLSTFIVIGGTIRITFQVYLEWAAKESYQWPDLMSIIVVLVYLYLISSVITMFALYGKHWLLRNKYRFKHDWGPYLTVGEKFPNEIFISWRKKYDDFSLESTLLEITTPSSKSPNSTPIISGRKPPNSTTANFHSYSVSNLTPGMTYEYRIKGIDSTFYFKTPAPKTPDSKYSFLAIGDLHAGGRNISLLVKRFKELQPEIQFILTLGDFVSDARFLSQWKTYMGQTREISPSLPILYAAGNHDAFTKRGYHNILQFFPQPYVNPKNGMYFSFAVGGVGFVSLDPFNGAQSYLRINDEQDEWARQTLVRFQQDNTIDMCILFLHHPPYLPTARDYSKDIERKLNSYAQTYPKLRLLLTGHVHLYEKYYLPSSTEVNPQYLFIIGGGGRERIERELLRYPPIARKQLIGYRFGHHFIRVDVAPQKITIKAISWDNDVFDVTEIIRTRLE